MSHVKKNLKNVAASIVGMVILAAIAAWQFYQFVMSESGNGHLWLAIALATLACGMAFLVFSVFVRHDTDDDLHITSTRSA